MNKQKGVLPTKQRNTCSDPDVIPIMSSKIQFCFKFLRNLFKFIIFIVLVFFTTLFSQFYQSLAPDVMLSSIIFLAGLTTYILTSQTRKEFTWNNFFPLRVPLVVFMLFMIFAISIHLHYRFGYPTTKPDIENALKPESIGLLAGIGIFMLGIYILVLNIVLMFPLVSVRYHINKLHQFRYINSRLITVIPLYIVIDLVFAFVYRLHSLTFHESFDKPISSFIDAFYFSTMIFTTLGYGDILPIDQSVRFLAAEEAIIGVIFIGVIVAGAISFPPPLSTVASEDIPKKSISGKHIK